MAQVSGKPEADRSGKNTRYYDYKLVIAVLVLCCFGLIMVYSSSSYVAAKEHEGALGSMHFVIRQGIFMAVGFVIMVVVSKIRYQIYVSFSWLFYAISLLAMILVDFTPLGIAVNGKKRWLSVVPGIDALRLQPTEMVKVALILLLALVINNNISKIDNWKTILKVILITIPAAGLVIINNLSSGLIIFGIAAVMFFVASRRKVIYAVLVGAAGVVAFLVVNYGHVLVEKGILKAYQLNRINVWLDPEAYPLDGGYQVLQGLYAIGSGGLFGKGLGNSMQKLGFVPEAQNDMIFSIICEELGLFGAVCLIALFTYIINRFIFIAVNAKSLLEALLVVGVMGHIAIQVILNIAVVTNSMPNTGVILPFISYGGTSVIFLMIEMGIVLGASNRIYDKLR